MTARLKWPFSNQRLGRDLGGQETRGGSEQQGASADHAELYANHEGVPSQNVKRSRPPAHFGPRLRLGRPLAIGLALIVELFALGYGHFHLDPALFQVDLGGDQR